MPSKKVLHQTEVLLNNRVDKEIEDMLKPLNILQTLYFFPKYTIRDGYITPNSFLRNIYTGVGAILLFSLAVVRIQTITRSAPDEFSDTLLISKYSDVLVYCIGFTVNAYVSIACSDVNVLLYLKIQTVNKFIPCRKIIKNVKYYSVFIMAVLFCVTILVDCYFYWSFQYFNFFDLALDTAVLLFDLNLVYASAVIKYLGDALEEMNNDILSLGDANMILFTATLKPDWDGISRTYINILDTYALFQDAFRMLIFFHSFNTFIHVFVYIQSVIEICKLFLPNGNYHIAVTVVIVVVVWLLRSIILQSLIGISCQNFYTATSNTQSVCSVLAKSTACDEQRLFLKTVQRLNDAAVHKLNIYGIFVVDASLPLRLMQVIATYTVVFLQFAFQ